MIPSNSTSSIQTDFRATVSANIEDAVSGELMTKAVTLVPCGHTFNEDTIIQCLARNKLCPLDRQPIKNYVPNYTIRHLAETATSHPLEKEPSEEAEKHFLRGKEYVEQEDHEAAIGALLQALQLSPTYEKAQAYLEFCLKRPSHSSSFHPSSSLPQPISRPLSEKSQEKTLSSSGHSREGYTELLFNLLEEPPIQENLALKKMLESQLEELMSQESEELTEKEKISYKWTKNLLGENKKIRQFALEKLQQIHRPSSPLPTVVPQSPASSSSLAIPAAKETQAVSPQPISAVTPQSPLYTPPLSSLPVKEIQAHSSPAMSSLYYEIVHFHFPHKGGDFTEQARIIDQIYKIEPTLAVEEKAPYIFKQVLSLAKDLSPIDFGEENTINEALTLSNYSSYLLNINRLILWQKLPEGKENLSKESIKALPLKQKGELLKAYIEELSKWMKEQDKSFTHLDLSESGLTFLPPEIGQLSQLQELDLSKNNLTTLPAEIGQLAQLCKLSLQQNQLVALPVEIGQLSQLGSLGLQQNQLTALPAEMKQLSQLRSLVLDGNQLTSLPAEVGRLSQLEKLFLFGNQLTSLPAEIGQLSRLRLLWLDQNQLTALPSEIGQLSQLKELYLSNNQLTALPAEMKQLSQLQVLNLKHNKLTILPAEIGQLSQLKHLGLSNNQLTTIPAEIGQLSRLRLLWLDQNQLTALPSEIEQLSQLQELYLDSNRLASLPVEIRKLPQLAYLGLGNNQLNALPPEIGQLSQLKELYLSINQLTSLPAEVGRLSQLEKLFLFGNQLTSLPAEIGQLSRLRLLWLDQNQLTALPSEIGQLSQLKELYLSFNQLTSLPAEVGRLSQLEKLFLFGNQLTSLPAEIIEQLSQCVILD
ncbi:Leucine-rich repeat protein SHOC-2 [Neochlamydia sp. EPS4]|uniref:leucine-rich repeat domain-containing protein n=1 Tax=Neochlamydia sp. EPS4 TaxID=1478175 RepID=UPI000583BD52|nr:leucine-rich repeat domain-containing protein [Neochlamydia sp. EPS4]KIC75240.1 Leucine-rich repeat protein SHOC-2 [Neochlamydia sp. EPS4]